MKDVWIKAGFFVQLIIVIGMLIATYVNVESRLSKIETNVEWIRKTINK